MQERPASEARFMNLYWPSHPAVLLAIRDHAHACRLRADAGDAPWGRLAAFTAGMTRRSLPRFDERPPPIEGYAYAFTASTKQRHGTTAALCDLLHDLIMEGV